MHATLPGHPPGPAALAVVDRLLTTGWSVTIRERDYPGGTMCDGYVQAPTTDPTGAPISYTCQSYSYADVIEIIADKLGEHAA
jgi:hypothetical protein